MDTLLYADLEKFIRQHEDGGAMATIILTTKKGVPNEGAFFVDEGNNVVFSKEVRNKNDLVEPDNWSQFRGSSTGTIIFKTDFLRQRE